MKKPPIWMPIFIGDHHCETAHLTTRQQGAYLLLLMATWTAGGSLVDDDARFAAITRLSRDEWAEERATLAELFAVADGKWSHARLIEELAHAADNKQKKSSAGSKGAAKRWQTDSPSPSPSSEAKASGTDVAAVVFGKGRDWLKETSGKPDAGCRVLLGRAQREGVIEPVGWIEKAIQTRDPPSNPRDFNRCAA